MKNKFNLLTIIALVLSLLFWGSAFPAIRATLETYSPGHLALFRLIIASLSLIIWAIIRGIRLPEIKDFPGILMLGITGIAVYHVALNYGETTISAGAAGFIIGSTPIFATLFSVFLLKDHPKMFAWIGIFISFLGITFIAFGESGGVHFSKGAFLVLLAAMSGGLYCVIQKKMLSKYSAFELTAYSMWIGTILTTFFIPGLHTAIQNAPLKSTIAVIYLGVFPAAFAYVTWAYILSKLSVARAVSFLYLVPIIAVIIAWFWLKETPKILSLIGGAVALAGVIIVNKNDINFPKNID